MKVNLSDYDFTDFLVKEGTFCGIPAKLITPSFIGAKFTQRNKIFRSSVWSLDGELLSAGLPKFTNFGENPEHFPVPKSLDDSQVIEKIDGSCAIFDYVNGRLNCRTRGTFSHKTLDNSADFGWCIAKYPKIESFLRGSDYFSLIFEITTPNLKIVLDYGNEPDFTLIGCIDKGDYSLFPQDKLDHLGEALSVKRPKSYTFDSLDAIIQDAATRQGVEGWCVYSNGGQTIHKIKSSSYLAKHRFKENATIENTIDLYFTYGQPDYTDFVGMLSANYDFECSQMVVPFVSRICDAMKEVREIVSAMTAKVETLKDKSRKDAALVIIQAYGGEQNNRAGMAFKLLDGKSLLPDDLKKLLFQSLKA